MKTGTARPGDNVDLPSAAATGFGRIQAAQNHELGNGINARIRLDSDIRAAVSNVRAVHGEGILAAPRAVDSDVDRVGLTAGVGCADVNLVCQVVGNARGQRNELHPVAVVERKLAYLAPADQ